MEINETIFIFQMYKIMISNIKKVVFVFLYFRILRSNMFMDDFP